MTPEQMSRIWYGFSNWCDCNPIEIGVLFGVTSGIAIIALYKVFKSKKKTKRISKGVTR